MKKKQKNSLELMLQFMTKNLPLLLLFAWAIFRPEQAGDAIKIFSGIMLGKVIAK
ncbi:MAG TPA: hypothetical protein VK983_05250 [Candidatus Limnocylindrales bacterium]|nr:hypothetical protein [Candidatus Limnocylindrales bacterium]